MPETPRTPSPPDDLVAAALGRARGEERRGLGAHQAGDRELRRVRRHHGGQPAPARRAAPAGRAETSIQLALAPDRVRRDLAEAGNTAPLAELDDLYPNASAVFRVLPNLPVALRKGVLLFAQSAGLD